MNTTQIFSYIQRDSTKTVNNSNLTHTVFVDTSGSTFYYGNKHKMKYIDIEMGLVENFRNSVKDMTVVGWSNNATLENNYGLRYEKGGTQPSCIFRNDMARKAFIESDVIVFLTDGQICQQEVKRFGDLCSDYVNKKLILCGLVYEDH